RSAPITPGNRKARGSALRSPAASSSCTAVASGSKAFPAGARRSRSRFRSRIDCAASGAAMSLVLIVEDNEKNLKLVRDVLQVKGYATLEATSAEDGIRIANEQRPDLVLMDIQLPGMNGIDALRVLRSDPATAAIPVIAV